MTATRSAIITAIVVSMFILPTLVAGADYLPPANEHFERTWARTDKPVADGHVDRTWMWGPGANTAEMWEPYLESPGGMRKVQYFDKSRMEENLTGEPVDSPWYVTNGLLVVEMVTGQIQVGEDSFEPHEAETNNVAGDREGTTGPNYAALDGLRPAVDDRGSEIITQTVDQDGNVSENPDLSDFGVYTSQYDDITGHNIAGPFWEFMTSSGLIYLDGQFVPGALFDPPVYATGRPITEPFWAWVPVGGEEQWVLIQAFERRVLTFTPGNPDGWKVEAGNVGRHYFEWRYGYPVDHDPPDDAAPPVNGDDNGPPPGNGDDSGPPPGNGDDNGPPPGNGDDSGPPPGNGDDDPGNGDDSDNGILPPTSLGMGVTAQVNTALTTLTVHVQLTNNTDWSGNVDLQLRCDGALVDTDSAFISAQGNASASLSHSSGNLVNIQACTVTALIGSNVVASDTVLIVNLL